VSGSLLRVEDLRTEFRTEDGVLVAVDGVSLELTAGETLVLVGESGSGKSMTALSVLRLVPEAGRITGGHVWFEGRDLLAVGAAEMRRVRGSRIAMVFQEPMTSLNPVFTCGDQVAESLEVHEALGRAAARERAIELLGQVGIPEPAERARQYPHELSGGMRQRVMIAMALACRPALLIADEPTTALDVTIQAQILELLQRLQAEMGMALLLITHDLGVVAGVADRVCVLYAGQVVESCAAAEVFRAGRHPYTAGLLASLPRVGERTDRLRVIPGQVPDASAFPPGCRFHPRCPVAEARCAVSAPPLLEVAAGHRSRCWRAGEIAGGLDPLGRVGGGA
jgi:oligopeptide/dipeptide ABC transporter ATP-binding protein